eukprot:366110-Chlamydomonas_euryale.AAC.12
MLPRTASLHDPTAPCDLPCLLARLHSHRGAVPCAQRYALRKARQGRCSSTVGRLATLLPTVQLKTHQLSTASAELHGVGT